MKSFILSVVTMAALSAVPAFAAPVSNHEITVGRVADRVRVESVTASIENVGGGAWVSQRVKAVATFSNACMVPHSDELIVATGYADNFDTLDLTLLVTSERACTMEFMPVTVTIDLGAYGNPRDGLFETVKVNDVVAK